MKDGLFEPGDQVFVYIPHGINIEDAPITGDRGVVVEHPHNDAIGVRVKFDRLRGLDVSESRPTSWVGQQYLRLHRDANQISRPDGTVVFKPGDRVEVIKSHTQGVYVVGETGTVIFDERNDEYSVMVRLDDAKRERDRNGRCRFITCVRMRFSDTVEPEEKAPAPRMRLLILD